MLTIDTLADEPRWHSARLHAVTGRCRGDALGHWGENLARRFGEQALVRVRRRLAPPLDELSPVLTARDWVPVHAQVAVTEAIVDELLGGDMRALYPLLVEDTRAGLGKVQLLLVRSIGAARALKQGPRAFGHIYDRGTAEAAVERHRARLEFRGHPLFAHPTWRLLQIYATRVLLELAGSPGVVVGEALGADAFAAIATW